MYLWQVIAQKELLQLSRDITGLLAGVLLPAIAMPMIAAVVWGKEAVKPHMISATSMQIGSSQADYERYVHTAWQWFTHSRFKNEDPQQLANRLQMGSFQTSDAPVVNPQESSDNFLAWCKTIAANYRTNVQGASASTLMQKNESAEFANLFAVVVEAIGNLTHVEFSPPENMREAAFEIRKAVEARHVDVVLKWNRIPVRDARGQLVDRWESLVLNDLTNTRSAQAGRRVKRLLAICSPTTMPPSGGDTPSTNGSAEQFLNSESIDVSNGLPLPPALRAALDPLATFVAFSLYVITLMSAFSFASEFGTTERVKKTLEPLLLTQASRSSIAVGKLVAVCFATAVASAITIACFWCVIQVMIPADLVPRMDLSQSMRTIAYLGLLLMPIVLSGSGVAMAVSFLSGNARTASSLGNFALWAMIAPGFIMFAGSDQVSQLAAALPMVGTSLMLKDLFKGEFDWLTFSIAMFSSLALAIASLILTVYAVNREKLLSDV